MHHEMTMTQPAIPADVPEWGFPDGEPQLVVAVPDGRGNWVLARLDGRDPFPELTPQARAFARALLGLAATNLDATEPSDMDVFLTKPVSS